MNKVVNFALTFAIGHLISGVACVLEPMCQVKLGLGALTAMSKQKYSSIAHTLNNCPALIESTINVFSQFELHYEESIDLVFYLIFLGIFC